MKNSVYSNNPHTIDDLKMTITEYIRHANRAIPNMVFENTVRRVNKCLETGGGQFEHYVLVTFCIVIIRCTETFCSRCSCLLCRARHTGARCWWRSWLRHCATSRNVGVSIPTTVYGIFHWHNPFGCTMALGSTQSLTEVSTGNISETCNSYRKFLGAFVILRKAFVCFVCPSVCSSVRVE
jgi:hypothetical protein